MKKFTFPSLLLVALILLFASCKKDPADSNSSYVKFKKNGEWITYKGLGEVGPDLGDATLTDLGVNGYSDDQKNIFSISIQVTGNTFNTGTYTSDKYPEYYMIVDYSENPDPSTIKYYDITDALNMPPSKYTVNISSITSTTITGTFTGNYLYDNFHDDDDADGGIVKITEGEFQVKRVR